MKTVKEGIELNLDDLMKVAGGTGNSKETMRIEVDELDLIAGGTGIDWGDPSKLPYTCPICNAVMTTKEEVLSHMTAEVSKAMQINPSKI